MADYNETLNLYKQLQKNGAEHVDANLSTQQPIGMSVEALDEAVYGAYEDDNNEPSNAGNRLLIETMKEVESGKLSEENRKRIENNIQNLKIPSAILQDMIANPLIDTTIEGDDVDKFVENKFKSSAGIQKANKIFERVEKEDKRIAEERRALSPSQPTANAQIDYNKLYEMIDNIVTNRFAEMSKRTSINEGKQITPPFNGLKAIQLKENGSFLMLDSDDNVYECKVVYKGKNKKKH